MISIIYYRNEMYNVIGRQGLNEQKGKVPINSDGNPQCFLLFCHWIKLFILVGSCWMHQGCSFFGKCLLTLYLEWGLAITHKALPHNSVIICIMSLFPLIFLLSQALMRVSFKREFVFLHSKPTDFILNEFLSDKYITRH